MGRKSNSPIELEEININVTTLEVEGKAFGGIDVAVTVPTIAVHTPW